MSTRAKVPSWPRNRTPIFGSEGSMRDTFFVKKCCDDFGAVFCRGQGGGVGKDGWEGWSGNSSYSFFFSFAGGLNCDERIKRPFRGIWEADEGGLRRSTGAAKCTDGIYFLARHGLCNFLSAPNGSGAQWRRTKGLIWALLFRCLASQSTTTVHD